MRKSESEREREICRIWLFLFLKGMTGALAPFSYLVLYNKLMSFSLAVTSTLSKYSGQGKEPTHAVESFQGPVSYNLLQP